MSLMPLLQRVTSQSDGQISCGQEWTDITIEQVFMRAMKTSGGLTRGCGMMESVINH